MNGFLFGLSLIAVVASGILTIGLLVWMVDHSVVQKHKIIVIISAVVFLGSLLMLSVTWKNWNAKAAAKKQELCNNGYRFTESHPYARNVPIIYHKFIFENGKDLTIWEIK